MKPSLPVRVTAEFLGTGLLVAAVVGSGIMAERLANGNAGLALLCNAIATGAALVALILAFGPISGAHLNPVVSMTETMDGSLSRPDALCYVIAQVSGGTAGTLATHAMFGLPFILLSSHARSGPAQFFSEIVATFGLLAVIRGCSRSAVSTAAFGVGSYITAAYWFTASTSFANPAVTIARSLSNTFAGIRPADVLPFIAAQIAGGMAAALLFRWLAPRVRREVSDVSVSRSLEIKSAVDPE